MSIDSNSSTISASSAPPTPSLPAQSQSQAQSQPQLLPPAGTAHEEEDEVTPKKRTSLSTTARGRAISLGSEDCYSSIGSDGVNNANQGHDRNVALSALGTPLPPRKQRGSPQVQGNTTVPHTRSAVQKHDSKPQPPGLHKLIHLVAGVPQTPPPLKSAVAAADPGEIAMKLIKAKSSASQDSFSSGSKSKATFQQTAPVPAVVVADRNSNTKTNRTHKPKPPKPIPKAPSAMPKTPPRPTPPPPRPKIQDRKPSPQPITPKVSNSTSPVHDPIASASRHKRLQVPNTTDDQISSSPIAESSLTHAVAHLPLDSNHSAGDRHENFIQNAATAPPPPAAAKLERNTSEAYSECDDSTIDGSVSNNDVPRRIVPDDISTFSCGSSMDDVSTLDNDPTFSLAGNSALSMEDLEICQKLDSDYERALEEREIGYNARYHSVRQAAVLSISFMLTFLLLGMAFFKRQTNWGYFQAFFFSIYTVTTVGYGSLPMPESDSFRLYAIFYILTGIGALTIMVAQVYQYIALEASRAQYSRDRSNNPRRGLEGLSRNETARTRTNGGNGPDSPSTTEEILMFDNLNMPTILDMIFRAYDRAKNFFMYNEVGRGLSVLFPFVGLVLIGAMAVGPIEGWGVVESIYFSVVSLTTVGYGDLYPTETLSIWFCILWLPFSAGFMSLFLGNVASFYIRLSDQNVQRLERHMRRRLHRAKSVVEMERIEALKRAYRGQDYDLDQTVTTDADGDTEQGGVGNSTIPQRHAERLSRFRQRQGFDALPSNEGVEHGKKPSSSPLASRALFGSSRVADAGGERRRRILENSANQSGMISSEISKRSGRTMRTMRDVVRRVRRNMQNSGSIHRVGAPDYEFMSIRSNQPMSSAIVSQSAMMRNAAIRKPSFALRVLVQERFAQIIAIDIAGFQSSIEIKETTLSVSIDTLKDTADKWQIPRRARRAFRAVAFEALYFVGEHGLITRGAKALLDLSPFEFHGLFSPLLAAYGDAETMENWLESTEVLAQVDLQHKPSLAHPTRRDVLQQDGRPLAEVMNDTVQNGSPTKLELPDTAIGKLAKMTKA